MCASSNNLFVSVLVLFGECVREVHFDGVFWGSTIPGCLYFYN